MPKVFIIAEAGVNHNGSLGLAYKLIEAAAAGGCDAVKFQTFKTDEIVSADAPKAAYQKRVTSKQESQRDMIRNLELDAASHQLLKARCRLKKILFLSTPFDEPSVDLLRRLKVPLFKVASGEITNLPFLRYVARQKRPLIVSTGMSTLDEVRRAVNTIYKAGNRRLTLLHCVTAYPAPLAQANLKAILTLQRTFGLPVGYSDHTLGMDACLGAVALGSVVIEKHFTLDKKLPGPDHQASLEPSELKEMVRRIRNMEEALGNGVKRPVPCERENIAVARKSLVARTALKKGQRLIEADMAAKRPGSGISPSDLKKIIGRRLSKPMKKDEMFSWKVLRDR